MNWIRKNGVFDKRNVITIYICMISIITLLIIGVIIAFVKNQEHINITYKEVGDVDYKVYLKENEFFKENYLEKNNQYIASIINNIVADFNYELDFDANDIDYKYTYRIEAVTSVKEKNTQNLLYKEAELLIPETEQKPGDSSKLVLNEQINIDYTKYNDLINKFVKIYELDNSESMLTINMYVNLLGVSTQRENQNPVISLNIPLTTKTVDINIDLNTINETKDYNKTILNSKIFIVAILLIIDIVLAIKLYVYIMDTKDEETIYKMKLRKIISNYGSYIQAISKDFDFLGYEKIELRTFESIIQIRDIVQQPILMLEREDETHFMIPTQNKLMYTYELNTGAQKKRIAEKSESLEITIE